MFAVLLWALRVHTIFAAARFSSIVPLVFGFYLEGDRALPNGRSSAASNASRSCRGGVLAIGRPLPVCSLSLVVSM